MTPDAIVRDAACVSALKELMVEASQAVMTIYGKDDFNTQIKADCSPVTEADKVSHAVLRKGLGLLTPSIPLMSEEDSASLTLPRSCSLYWLADPLDGTKEFIKRNGEFTVNLALIEKGETRLGFVTVPTQALHYWGGKNWGAWRAGFATPDKPEPLHVAPMRERIRIVASKSHGNVEISSFLDSFGDKATILHYGSSLKFLRVAEGLADLYPRLTPTSEWDTAAAQAILEGAGGAVQQLNGLPLIYGKEDIINPRYVAIGSESIWQTAPLQRIKESITENAPSPAKEVF